VSDFADVPLFDAPRARNTDPSTSHEAAAKVAKRAPTIRTAVLDTLRLYFPRPERFTLEEVVAVYRRRVERGAAPRTTDSSVRTRVSELVTLGEVRDTGEKIVLYTSRAGRRCILWELTED